MFSPGRAVIGILGGGQLGRMIALAAARFGYTCHIWCQPGEESPASQVAAYTFCAPYDDEEVVASFARSCQLATVEFENVPVSTLIALAKRGLPIHPRAEVLTVAQDRIAEKRIFESLNLQPVAWCEVECESGSIRRALDALGGGHALLKTVRGGYDGKGQWLISPHDDLDSLCNHVESFLSVAKPDNTQLILEERIADAREISAIIARRADGDYTLFPLSENEHEDGILRRSRAPACIHPDSADHACQATITLAESLNVVGLLAVEMFLLPAGTVLLNEIAPRPHNSGHWTLDGCMTSQFEQLIRAICNLPLGCTTMIGSGAEMTNLLGDQVVSWKDCLAQPGLNLHLYGKSCLRPGRKMGHVTRILPR